MLKKLLMAIAIMASTIALNAQSITITQAEGWFEAAYVTWEPIANADSYNVYITGEGVPNQKIDNQLIRSYGTYYRADILGLKAGNYTVSVASVVGGLEDAASTSSSITVMPHDRTGFAFSNNRVPGAYKLDGTPKDNAVIVYITENTKNTASMDVTGASTNPCVGLQAILDGYKKGKDNRPLILRLIGQITDPLVTYNGDIVIENANAANSFITLEGVGDDAVADGWGIRIKNASNIEIRNLGTMNCNSSEGDNIGLQQNNDYVWVHHCDFFYGDAGSDADQAKGDGALDCKKSTFVTFSYNHFWDSGKGSLLGLSEGSPEGLYVTYHHNWFDHSDSRHPRVRFYSAHVYNNYYDGNSKYGVGATEGSSVFVEANYFRNCKYPMLISMQGSDVFNESTQKNDYVNMPTFSKENGGIIKSYNNTMTGQKRFIPYKATDYTAFDSSVDFDAYEATSRYETVPSSVVAFKGAKTYNNFDTDPAVMYSYTPDSPDDAMEKVKQYAGRVNGGDFKFTFNNAVDDASYAVNTTLKNALTQYKTTLVAIQGDASNTGGGDTGGGDTGGGDTGGGISTGDMVHNFTLAGKTSTFYTISGNLSSGYGSVSYAGLTLTQCLKMESSTTITFTTTQTSTLTLVFNSSYTGTVKIDGTTHTPVSGIIELTIGAGSHTILKASGSSYLFYMSVAYPISTSTKNAASPQPVLYPNPVVSNLNISTPSEVKKVDVYNLAGTLVTSAQGNVKTIELQQLVRGFYLVKVYTNNGMFQQSIVKK
jgi:pectate lyase